MSWTDVKAKFEAYAVEHPTYPAKSYKNSMEIFATQAEALGIPSDKAEQTDLTKLFEILPEGVHAAKRKARFSMEELIDLAYSKNSIDLRIALGTLTQDVVYAYKGDGHYFVNLTPAQYEFVTNAARRKIVFKQLGA